ncbi:protein LEAD-SENSITIVE 1-like [Lycium barbarum]|uniref:protein LEAD-SENSITIVE 1-like n=1 Tax=Lycium barbarum TaxID=112863 RepID=UPI00293E3C89|nr:protein LEAD-SENSITIVE 1-like [Lycium barbarum]XP_060173002.1 protein LEAD-SENSITIVE 1-like [Lycium barbarum]XP_060173003.1 protein LEAD-SENSITIVE 1-like [Lycium barbarum]XP_060173004.1 protein LEAD-SENSITIVE 1-like [Lycium barbarum]
MGLLTQRVERSELVAGDHIYTWRTLFAYSHHGIYVGDGKVVHYTQQNSVSGEPILSSAPFKCSSASSANVCLGTEVSTTCSIPECLFQQKRSGVVLSCLNCFLGGGKLYRFEYGVNPSFFFTRIRGGTCTTAQSDPPEEVIYRAMYLLQHGFGSYDAIMNNCEDFALYCKTGRVHEEAIGRSGQIASVVGAPFAAIVSLPLKLFVSNPAGVVLTAGIYSLSRYASDLGVSSGVTKVEVEELTSFRDQKTSKKNHK